MSKITPIIRLIVPLLLSGGLLAGCLQAGERSGFTREERRILQEQDSVLYVTVVTDPSDSLILRTPCTDLSDRALRSENFRLFAEKLKATVQAPWEEGVGIAGPQVGINRRVICVQRFDKAGEPFEVYANIRIDSLFGPVTLSREGCLSVPDLRGYVPRRDGAVISYTDPGTLSRVSETVRDFTAIIFQHECDHLDGILYTDRADSVFFSEQSAAERKHYDSLGYYVKPQALIR